MYFYLIAKGAILRFSNVSYFFLIHFFQRSSTDILEIFPHDVALIEKTARYASFLKEPVRKMRGETTPIFTKFRT